MKLFYDAFLGILSDGELMSISSAKFASPLGLNVLGTKIKQSCPDILVRIYNLEVSDRTLVLADMEKIIKNNNNVLVGLTLIAGNVLRALQLADWLKNLNCDVIVGGPEIDNLTINHFASLSKIDAVCVGFGEHIIVDIIKKGIKRKIYYTPQYFDFENSSVDYSLIFELEKHGGVSMLWGGDCHLCNQRCYFCSRHKSGFGWRDPQMVWEELKYPYQLGIKKFYNTADTVAVNINKFKKLAELKPRDLSETKIKCFINATQINNETAKALNKLNAWAAIGMETCSRVGIVGKGKTQVEDNYQAVEILTQHGINMILTFVMGLPGENNKSLENDKNEILKLVYKYHESIYWITVSPLLITLGSRAFKDSGNVQKRNLLEYYSPLLMSEQYFKRHCEVGLDEVYVTIMSLKKQIHSIDPRIIFDSKGLDPERWYKINKFQ